MTQEQPKPCPCCGSTDLLVASGWKHGVICNQCGVSSRSDTKAEALAAWNRRSLPWVPVAERLPEPEQLCLWLMTPAEPGPCLAHVGRIRDMGMLELVKHWLPLSPDFFPAVDKLAQGGAGK